MILRTFNEPTNVIILGTNIGKYTNGFITNKLNITLLNGNNKCKMGTDGGFTILTEEEFFEYDFYIKQSSNPYEDYALLKNYKGDIVSIPHKKYSNCTIGVYYGKVEEESFFEDEFNKYRKDNREVFKRLRTINKIIN